MLYLMLFHCIVAVSFIRLLITNSAIYAVKIEKFTDKKTIYIKSKRIFPGLAY